MSRGGRRLAAALVAVLAVSCGDSAGTAPTTTSAPARPYDVFVPSAYDGSTAVPLMIVLHGYASTGAAMASVFGLETLAEDRGFLAVHPDGTRDRGGAQFWNATDGCCNRDGLPVDDSAYLAGIIDEVSATHRVDPRRVYVVGLSNGGFMSYRMACDHADTVAAIVSLAGATFLDAASCAPSQPVSVLQIHGTDDAIIPYDGGRLMGPAFPSAPGTVAMWAAYDGCGVERADTGRHLDLAVTTDGPDTTVSAHPGCSTGIDVELWTVEGAGHVFAFTSTLVPAIVDFLLAHPKP